jgi:hypothetical protein
LADRYWAIQQRCENPNNPNYPNYGGRGIKNRFKDAVQFVNYILTALPHSSYLGLEIERQNNNGHYEPGNLRLTTSAVNQRNKRTNRWVDYKGRKIIATDLHAQLQTDFPAFKLCLKHTMKLLKAGYPWQYIVERKARGPYKKRSSTISRTQARGIDSQSKVD